MRPGDGRGRGEALRLTAMNLLLGQASDQALRRLSGLDRLGLGQPGPAGGGLRGAGAGGRGGDRADPQAAGGQATDSAQELLAAG